MLALVAWLVLVSASPPPGCWEPSPQLLQNQPLQNQPVPPHPRLRLNDTQLAQLSATIASNNDARTYFDGMHARGVQMLAEPLADCSTGTAGLDAARGTLQVQYTLGLLWRLTGDERFAARAANELVHVTTNCTSWDPFGLVLAEMTHAVGIGFDWLFAYLSAADKSAIVAGVGRLGLAQALHDYAHGEFWTNCTFNWGVVTNGGLTVGALAFVDTPGIGANASDVIARAKAGIRCPFSSFSPDGGWHEGFMYWQYVAEYAQALTESLVGVLGDDYGLSRMRGYNETGLFRLHMNGPAQSPFDFGDAEGGLNNSAAGFFMGYSQVQATNAPTRALYAYEGRRLARIIGGGSGAARKNCGAGLGSLDCSRMLLEFAAGGSHASLAAQPLAKAFRLSAFDWDGRLAIGFFRSGWSAEEEGTAGKQAWLAFKAPNGVPNHNDLDGGSFVFETGGRRWAMDMGSDSYQLPGYFTQDVRINTRYNLYRKATVGHNTLVLNADVSRACMQVANGCADAAVGACAQEHTAAGVGNISLFESRNDSARSPAYAVVDMSAAHAAQGATRVERGFAFTQGHERLVVVDELDFAAASGAQNVSWSMHTLAHIELVRGQNGAARAAVLRQGEDTLHVTVLEPEAFTLRDVRIELAPPQMPSAGVRKLVLVAAAAQLTGGRIVVSLSMKEGGSEPNVSALAEWKSAGPFA